MSRAWVLALALGLAAPAAAGERLGVVAVADPPAGPDADLAELAHQLRAACRDRAGGVEDVPTMRARLLGRTSNATLSELDRAYGGALAVYQNGEFESALRTLHAIVEDLERLPETDEGHAQWVRAQLRLAHAALTIGREDEAEAALLAVARTDAAVAADPDLYSPSYRRRLEAVKARVRSLPARRLTVTAEGRAGTVYVNGRAMGTTPVSLSLPAGTYRIGGAAEGLRVPGFTVDLGEEDRSAVLDFSLAEALRPNAGPGLALPAARRGDGLVRAGAWLGVDRLLAVSRAHEGEAAFLLGSIYDVRRGALLREGSVRMVAGTVPSSNLGALAAFLLTGQSSRDVKDRTDTARERSGAPQAAAPGADRAPAPAGAEEPAGTARASLAVALGREELPLPREAPPGARGGGRWLARGALGAAALATTLAGFAVQQGLSARDAWAEADAMVAGGVFRPGTTAADVGRYHALRDDASAARRNAYVSAGAAAALAAAAGVLGWRWAERAPPGPAGEPTLALRF